MIATSVSFTHSGHRRHPWKALAPGWIFEIARAAGVLVQAAQSKVRISCPFHDDIHPSAFLSERNVFFCSVCTSTRGWTAKQFAHALKVRWHRGNPNRANSRLSVPTAGVGSRPPGPSQDEIRQTWDMALARATDDDHIGADRPVYEYLSNRGLMPAWEDRAFGILADGMPLPQSIAWWPRNGYQVVAPLYDLGGEIRNLQTRSIRNAPRKKTLFPKGLTVKGMVFANAAGVSLLRGTWNGDPRVVLGEGLTDFLALAMTCAYPVLAAPGTGVAVSAVGAWARDRVVVIASDCDVAGEATVAPVADAAFLHGALAVFRLQWLPPSHDACEELANRGVTAFTSLLDDAPMEASHVC